MSRFFAIVPFLPDPLEELGPDARKSELMTTLFDCGIVVNDGIERP